MPGGATYGASADFNKFKESEIRWVTPSELAGWLDESRSVLLLDVREPAHYQAGTIAGARSYPQGSLFMDYKSMQPQTDEIVAAAATSELVLFANTGGVGGPSASRDLYVLNFLAEIGGLGVDRMVRLEGGLDAWKRAGFEALPPPKPAPTALTLDAILEEAGFAHLAEKLAGHSFESLAAVFESDGRQKLLDLLKGLGLTLPERQKVANAVSKAVKAMRES